MNYSHMTDAEFLRVVQPNTELERHVFNRLSEAPDEIISLEDEVAGISQDSDCFGCDERDSEITTLEERIEYLEGRLDEHKIEYTK